MPELPEVETIRLGLERKIVGLTIKDVELLSPKSFIGKAQEVKNKKVIGVWRRAKILGIELEGEITLLFHLKMTGQLIWKGESVKGKGERFVGGHPTPDMRDQMPNSHTRVIFSFSDKLHLYFNDQRRFGWVRITQNLELKTKNIFGKLGPEPLEKEFIWEVLKSNLLKHKSMPIKIGRAHV